MKSSGNHRKNHPMSEGPIYVTVDGPYITDEDRARAMRMTVETGRAVHMTVRPQRWWQFWKLKEHHD